ncbi:FAD-linked oxidase C-terminal domain-containing protein [Gammaproteobacteria bacterium]|nr:FAD-linked oxidase C-terminal domain-containing protein [Gammaproteobacteria bacterium]
MDEGESGRRVNRWLAEGLPIDASCWQQGRLQVRLRGAVAAVNEAVSKIQGESGDPALWAQLRDRTHPLFTAASLWRIALPPLTPVFDLGASPLVSLAGGERWYAIDDDGSLRHQTIALGGHASHVRGAADGDYFQPLSPTMLALQQRLKSVFDPQGILNPGRHYPAL